MRVFLSCLILLCLSVQAQAAGCYNSSEAVAEQGIRIHSELMVIGLNCQHMTPRGWKNFYQEYREITSRHRDLFSGYEQTLINYNSRNGGSAEKKMHHMRTAFANKVSTDAAQMRPDIFCATYAPRIPAVAKMSRQEFQNWIVSAAQSQPQTQPSCQ